MEYEAAYMAGRDTPSSIGTREVKSFESNGPRSGIVQHAKRLAPFGKRLVSISADGVMVWNQLEGWFPSQRSTR
jgi:hypothetical protein